MEGESPTLKLITLHYLINVHVGISVQTFIKIGKRPPLTTRPLWKFWQNLIKFHPKLFPVKRFSDPGGQLHQGSPIEEGITKKFILLKQGAYLLVICFLGVI